MKNTLVVLTLLLATAAFGQASGGGAVLISEPQPLQMPSHPQRAMTQSMGQFQSLYEPSNFTSASGERPLWEFAPKQVETTPLGDVARMLRKERETTRKAEKVWTN